MRQRQKQDEDGMKTMIATEATERESETAEPRRNESSEQPYFLMPKAFK